MGRALSLAEEPPVIGDPPIALTMGDPAGIGGEITVAAWRALRAEGGPPFLTIDDPKRLTALGAPVQEIDHPREAARTFSERLPVLPEPLSAPCKPGAPDALNAQSTVRSIKRAAALAQTDAVSAIVTNPINKRALYEGVGFPFPGHTEFLAELGGVDHTVMMLCSPSLRVVPVTIHIPLAEAPKKLTSDLLDRTLRMTHRSLVEDFNVPKPRIAVAALNPHAGEGGAMGREEITVIAPIIARLSDAGIDIRGPLPADTMFHPRARTQYDVAVCMYHDQALIPLKALDFDRGVNVTLGLPFVRTSPDHGVAYDIAGAGLADPSSLIAAVKLAASLAQRRRARRRA